jgi:hypothetical protein
MNCGPSWLKPLISLAYFVLVGFIVWCVTRH